MPSQAALLQQMGGNAPGGAPGLLSQGREGIEGMREWMRECAQPGACVAPCITQHSWRWQAALNCWTNWMNQGQARVSPQRPLPPCLPPSTPRWDMKGAGRLLSRGCSVTCSVSEPRFLVRNFSVKQRRCFLALARRGRAWPGLWECDVKAARPCTGIAFMRLHLLAGISLIAASGRDDSGSLQGTGWRGKCHSLSQGDEQTSATGEIIFLIW